MKAKLRVTKEVEITHIKLSLPVCYGDEDIPYDFPLRKGDMWIAMVNIDTGQILDWPKDKTGHYSLSMKVTDSGTYTLYSNVKDPGLAFGGIWEKVAEISEDYVPNKVVPGSYGDYVELEIQDGVITNWPKKPDLSAFFGRGD